MLIVIISFFSLLFHRMFLSLTRPRVRHLAASSRCFSVFFSYFICACHYCSQLLLKLLGVDYKNCFLLYSFVKEILCTYLKGYEDESNFLHRIYLFDPGKGMQRSSYVVPFWLSSLRRILTKRFRAK